MTKNWQFALLIFFFVFLCTSLGFWQLSRAQQKKILFKTFAIRQQQVLSPTEMSRQNIFSDQQFYQAKLQGRFDNQHTLLLDNKIFHGQLGYEVYTPFRANHLPVAILIDRGFIPAGANRTKLPAIHAINGDVTLKGMLNQPPAYVALGQMLESQQLTWPLRIEFVKLSALTKLLKQPLFPYILQLSPDDPAAYAIEWQISSMGPERHKGYAVQWFALALVLLILFIIFSRRVGISS